MITTNHIVMGFISFTLLTITYSNCSQVPTGSLYSSSEYCQEGQAAQNCKGNLYEVGFDSSLLPPFNLGYFETQIIGLQGNCYDGGYPVAKVEYHLYASNGGDYAWGGVEDCLGGRFTITNQTQVPGNFQRELGNYIRLNMKVYESVDSRIPINKTPNSRGEATIPIPPTTDPNLRN